MIDVKSFIFRLLGQSELTKAEKFTINEAMPVGCDGDRMKALFQKRLIGIAVLSILALWAGGAGADRIILTGGTTLNGVVTGREGGQATISLEGGGAMTLPEEMIEKIESVEPESSAPAPTVAATALNIEIILPTETPTPTPTSLPQEATASRQARRELTEEEIQEIGQGRKRFGITRDTVGIVEVKRPEKAWVELAGETVLFEGDEVRTQNGRTKIFLDEPTHETEIRVNENSELKIPVSEPVSTIDLLRGKMWSRIKALSAAEDVKFQVRTPNAVAGVRGTLLYVQLLPEDAKVAVLEGQVMVVGRTHEETRQEIGPMRAVLVSRETESFTRFLDVNPDEIKEWDEWDEWAKQTKANLAPYTANVPGARALIEGQIDQVAAEGKLYAQMAEEGNQLVLQNRQADQLESIKQSILRYVQDMGRLPAQDKGLDYIQNNLESSRQWRGPYLDPQFSLPVRDLWGQEVIYRIQKSPQSGRIYAELISGGPNGRFDEGRADDIKVLVVPN